MVLVISWLCIIYGLVSVLLGIIYLIGLYFEYKELAWRPEPEKGEPKKMEPETVIKSQPEDITIVQVLDGRELADDGKSNSSLQSSK